MARVCGGGIEGNLVSLVCGVYLLKPGAALPVEWVRHLQNNLNRGTSGSNTEFRDERFFLMKLDIGAFDAPGWLCGERYVTALSGDCILGHVPMPRGRADDMQVLGRTDVAALTPLLRDARGYFNLVHYDRSDHRLALATDRIGVRSLYVYRDPGFLVFSGAMRLIESLPGLRLTVDLQGVLETACFGNPLSTRTRYKEVTYLLGGSQLLATDRRVSTERYWKFDRDDCTEITQNVDDTLDELYETFQTAVRLRAGRRKAVFSALSGGLDSRSVTAELWRQRLQVHSLNVSWKDSLDDVLGSAFAAKLGIKHHHVDRPLQEAGNSLARRLFDLMTEKAALCADLPSTARQIWSGNGGSLGMGHTKMTAAASEKLRAGDVAGAARHFLSSFKFNLSGKLLSGEISEWAEALPFNSLMAELGQIECPDPARALYFFRLDNDQRWLLAFHFEQIDRVPFEFIEPLFDPEVISVVCRLPMDFCLRHHMYHEWLKRLPPEVTSVAWQVYPGHEPCPIPLPEGAYTQWQTPHGIHHGRSLWLSLQDAIRHVGSSSRYRGLLRTDRVIAAQLLRGLGLRDTSHLLKQVDLIGNALERAGGRVDLPL